jgi:hypothetical protein
MAHIPLYRAGAIVAWALVSPEDHEQLSRYRWRPSHTGYATCQIWLSGKPTNKKMHRAVMFPGYMGGPNTGRVGIDEVDHINGDRLDNRRENLRLANRSQNQWNSIKKPGNNPAKGVYRRVGRSRFEARVTVNRRVLYLGDYATAEEAAAVVAEARIRLHGEYARPA